MLAIILPQFFQIFQVSRVDLAAHPQSDANQLGLHVLPIAAMVLGLLLTELQPALFDGVRPRAFARDVGDDLHRLGRVQVRPVEPEWSLDIAEGNPLRQFAGVNSGEQLPDGTAEGKGKSEVKAALGPLPEFFERLSTSFSLMPLSR